MSELKKQNIMPGKEVATEEASSYMADVAKELQHKNRRLEELIQFLGDKMNGIDTSLVRFRGSVPSQEVPTEDDVAEPPDNNSGLLNHQIQILQSKLDALSTGLDHLGVIAQEVETIL